MSALTSAPAWAAGLGNQTRREASMWWSGKRWWRQALVWTLILGGLLVSMLWVLPAVFAGIEGTEAMTDDVVEVAAQFTELAAFVSAVGAVILTQGILLDDQRSGLTEWVLSKPLSRPALVLAKLAGHGSGLLVSVVAIPWTVVYVVLSVGRGAPWPLGRFLGAVTLVGLFVVFHLALVLALSAVTRSRGVVLAVPLALLVTADVVVTAVPWLADGSPYLVSRVAAALVAVGELAAAGPPVAAGVAAAGLTAVAVRWFARQEL